MAARIPEVGRVTVSLRKSMVKGGFIGQMLTAGDSIRPIFMHLAGISRRHSFG
jgi:hypothetical protein